MMRRLINPHLSPVTVTSQPHLGV
uniref:Uncharacterized protein n=1 Tax=Arundo donax TaxID=35708 RepID=A0A0A9FJ29_ARUDO